MAVEPAMPAEPVLCAPCLLTTDCPHPSHIPHSGPVRASCPGSASGSSPTSSGSRTSSGVFWDQRSQQHGSANVSHGHGCGCSGRSCLLDPLSAQQHGQLVPGSQDLCQQRTQVASRNWKRNGSSPVASHHRWDQLVPSSFHIHGVQLQLFDLFWLAKIIWSHNAKRLNSNADSC